jgi:hypothetical protein
MRLPAFTATLVATATLLAGCGSSTLACRANTDYAQAKTVAALKPGNGVEPPVSPGALRIPELTAEPVPFAEPIVVDNKKGTRCLDFPPAISIAVAASVPAPATAALPAK